jgi:hypothetical protein
MQRLRFAGWEAAIGVFVLGAFAVLGLLGLLGLTALVLTGQVAFGRDVAFGLVVLAGALGAVLVRGQRQFCTLEIADDGTWTLRDSLGRRLGRIAPDAQRSLVEQRRETWMYIGTARKYTRSWFDLVSGDRTYRSCHGIPKFQAPAREALGRWLKP